MTQMTAADLGHPTRSRATTILGAAVLAGIALWLFLAFVATGPDVRIVNDVEVGQFDAFRLIYVHVPAAITPTPRSL